MAEMPEDLAGPDEPFTPSIFLDLPPTPHVAIGDDEDLASSDDMVIPFIRRMLMEDANDDIMYQYHPDHPALLQAEQPFAQILSGSASAATSSPAPHDAITTTTDSSVSGSASATSSTNATRCGTFPDGASPGLRQSVGDATASASAFFNGGGAKKGWAMTTVPPGDGATMDMLNLAFLRGVEEASKFLPTIVDLGATSEERERLPLFKRSGDARGWGCKENRHIWDDDYLEAEAEAGRRSKLIASAEPEETDQVTDGVFLEGYEVALEKMDDLFINSSSSVPAPAPGDGEEDDKLHAQGQQLQRSSNEAVDLRTLLIHCAEVVSKEGPSHIAMELLKQIKRLSSPTGDGSQRLAHCFAQGLELRLAGQQAHRPPMAGAGLLLKAYILYLRVCPFKMTAFKFSNIAISKALALAAIGTGRRRRKKKVHIVDYGVHHGLQWPLLLGAWAKQEGGPPEVRITGIDFPQSGFRPAAWIDDTGRRLTDFARQRGVPFNFRSIIASKWETVSTEDLDIDPDEVLIVNGLFLFSKLMDEGTDIDSPCPRDMVLASIKKMRPDVFILCIDNSSHNTPFFVSRFREALFYYSAMFDMMDATVPRDSAERILVEQELFGRRAFNAIVCEGPNRVDRPEAYKQWQVRTNKAGLRQLPLDPDKVKYLSKRVKDGYHKDFVTDVDRQWVLQGWKGRILCAMSTWYVDDDNAISRQF